MPATPGQTFTLAQLQGNQVRYAPLAGFSGTVSFSFQVQDDGGTNNGGIDLAQNANLFQIRLEGGVINQAPSGADNTFSAFEGQPRTLTASDFGFSDALNSRPITSKPSSSRRCRTMAAP